MNVSIHLEIYVRKIFLFERFRGGGNELKKKAAELNASLSNLNLHSKIFLFERLRGGGKELKKKAAELDASLSKFGRLFVQKSNLR